MKKLISIVLALTMVIALAACGSSSNTAAPAAADNAAPAAAEPAAAEEKTFVVGICQFVQHVALDSATQGFKDALTEALGDKVSFREENASGDIPTCGIICNQFVAEKVDLIMANATPALQAAATATSANPIPVLGTSVTEYGTALDIDDFSGTTGVNISGTSDLAPLADQADMFAELLPEAKTIGILYCSAEPNSVYQAKVVKERLEANGYTVKVYTFADSNELANVVTSACSEGNDALYIPTDNTAASATETINNVAQPAGIPIICGEEGICKGCGIATLSIDYYSLGVATGKMAVRILTEGEDVSAMEIEYDPNPVKKYNAELCSALGITIPDTYEAIA